MIKIGEKFGRLTITGRDKSKYQLYFATCDCGNTKSVYEGNLKKGKTRSCGCLYRETRIGLNKKHGERKSRLYSTWINIKSRCLNSNVNQYKDYGGRGIQICDHWENSYETFRNWALKNGYNDTLSIERKDVNGNYEPSNCEWANKTTQARNKRTSVKITVKNITKTLKEWCVLYNLNYKVMHQRMTRDRQDISKLIETLEEVKK